MMYEVNCYGYKNEHTITDTFEEAVAIAKEWLWDFRLEYAEIRDSNDTSTIVFWYGEWYVCRVDKNAPSFSDCLVMVKNIGGTWADIYYAGGCYLTWDYDS